MSQPMIQPSQQLAPASGAENLLVPDAESPAFSRRLKTLGSALVFVLITLVALIYYDSRQSAQSAAYIAAAGEMRMLSQRLAKAASFAIRGNRAAFAQLKESRGRFALLLDRLSGGGELDGLDVRAAPPAVRPALRELAAAWQLTQKNADSLLKMEQNLLLLGSDVAAINGNNAQLLDEAEELAAYKLASGSATREVAAASQLVMLTQRIARNASALLVGDAIDPEVAFLLGKDTNTFRKLLDALGDGSAELGIKAADDALTRQKLDTLFGSFSAYQTAVGGILSSIQPLVLAKQAGASIFRDSEDLLAATDRLALAFQENLFEHRISLAAAVALGGLALLILALIARAHLAESARRAALAEASRLESERQNRANQEAILCLMNEMGALADGDLTVIATVSEDITGAIADSVNYTVEELRVLVGRINDAASRVTHATGIARQISAELLAASQQQAQAIGMAGDSALGMAASMNAASEDAARSATVARQSLAAAGKGAQAVQDAISGMNEIRARIDETARRIRRLGDSSQEIGEIVALISDISEQTNVLALNAAIQAASAGEAGRGFSIVAEEVQHLAERSAKATGQIVGIVRNIQSDTQNAALAMAQSSRGVFDGERLSAAAGQALSEIGSVSQNLAVLIDGVAAATSAQAAAATGVAGRMQDILRATEQATAGSARTAEALDGLVSLADELKGSVAGFKVRRD